MPFLLVPKKRNISSLNTGRTKAVSMTFVQKVLGADGLIAPLELLRLKLAKEPSIRGSKVIDDDSEPES